LAETVHDTDQSDIADSLQGDGEAYARLVRRYQDRVAAQMWHFTRNTVILDELVQDVFVEAYLSLKGFHGGAPFLHWLRRIASRVGYRYWKSRARKQDREEALTDNCLNQAAVENLTPFEAAESLYRLLARLSPPDRLVMTLFYFEECDTNEIAARMGWSRTLVKVRLHRTRKKLESLLNEAGFGRR
jgi:RNA polymerase sigma-70 factor (ECF subfamily)